MNQSTQTGRHTLSSSVPPLFIKWFADITIGDIPLVGQEDRCDGADVLVKRRSSTVASELTRPSG